MNISVNVVHLGQIRSGLFFCRSGVGRGEEEFKLGQGGGGHLEIFGRGAKGGLPAYTRCFDSLRF